LAIIFDIPTASLCPWRKPERRKHLMQNAKFDNRLLMGCFQVAIKEKPIVTWSVRLSLSLMVGALSWALALDAIGALRL